MPPCWSSVCIDVSWVDTCILEVMVGPAEGILDCKTCTCKSELNLSRVENIAHRLRGSMRLLLIKLSKSPFTAHYYFDSSSLCLPPSLVILFYSSGANVCALDVDRQQQLTAPTSNAQNTRLTGNYRRAITEARRSMANGRQHRQMKA